MKELQSGKLCSLLGCTGTLREGQRFCDSCIISTGMLTRMSQEKPRDNVWQE